MKVHAKAGRKLFQIVSLENILNPIATPLLSKSGMIKSLSKADGYIIVDDNSEGYNKNDTVKVYRFGD